LRRRAALLMRNERDWHTLQPTAVVHEAFIRLFYEQKIDWENSAQFFFVATREMRHVLTEYARARLADKRGGALPRVSLEDVDIAAPADAASVELAGLGEALDKLSEMDDELARIVELRYFGGMSSEELSMLLGLSVSEVGRRWRLARALLRNWIG
jgi:RNA polymerase sigma factor (TIGR02999 family)